MMTLKLNEMIQHAILFPLELDAVGIRLRKGYGSGGGAAMIDTHLSISILPEFSLRRFWMSQIEL